MRLRGCDFAVLVVLLIVCALWLWILSVICFSLIQRQNEIRPIMTIGLEGGAKIFNRK
jgi:hypothetical protein